MAAMTNVAMIAIQEAMLIADGVMNADEEIHTFQRWKAMGYSVKKGEHAIAKFPIWKMGTKKDKDGEEVETGRMFMKTSAFFKTSQVEPMKEKVTA